jgi:hypothetical protein
MSIYCPDYISFYSLFYQLDAVETVVLTTIVQLFTNSSIPVILHRRRDYLRYEMWNSQPQFFHDGGRQTWLRYTGEYLPPRWSL